MKIIQNPIIGMLIAILLISGCSSAPENLTATNQAAMPPTQTSTPLPTNLPTATPTSTITPTASPSASPSPTASMTIEPPGDPISQFVDGMKIISYDGFDSGTENGWEFVSDRVVIEDDMVQMDSKIYRDTRLIQNDPINTGEGVIFDFKFNFGSQLYAYLDHSMFIKDDYKRFGVETGTNTQTNIRDGIELVSPALLVGNITPKPDTWYSMLLAVDEAGEMLVMIWDPENPTSKIRYYGNFNEDWENLPWQFAVSINKGNLSIDNYRKFTFNTINLP